MRLELDEMQCKAEVTDTRRIKLPSSKGFQKWFEIHPRGIQMALKIHSRGLLRGQAEKKKVLKVSRTPQGSVLGSRLGVQNRSKVVKEAF